MILPAAVLAGAGLHAGLGLLERAVPAIAPGFDPFLRILPALLVGGLVARRRRPALHSLLAGAWAGALAGCLGILASWALGSPPDHLLSPLVSVTGTSLIVAGPVAVLGVRGQGSGVRG